MSAIISQKIAPKRDRFDAFDRFDRLAALGTFDPLVAFDALGIFYNSTSF
jgi:hypothetical protein